MRVRVHKMRVRVREPAERVCRCGAAAHGSRHPRTPRRRTATTTTATAATTAAATAAATATTSSVVVFKCDECHDGCSGRK